MEPHGAAPEALSSLRRAKAKRLRGLRTGYRKLENDLRLYRQAAERLRFDALHDTLTQLPNRALLMERLDRCVARAARDPEFNFAVLFFDIDDFKLINDTLGHDLGDAVLLEIARRLAHAVRPFDTISRGGHAAPAQGALPDPGRTGEGAELTARLGGDEFVVMLENLPSSDVVLNVARRLQSQLSQPIHISGRELTVTASMGIAIGRGSELSAAGLLRDADAAMYRAKRGGKGRFAVYDDSMQAAMAARIELEARLSGAVERGEFALHYQPIIQTDHGSVFGFETLLRWNLPDGRVLTPDGFLEAAEQSGAIIPIGRWVLRAALEQVARWNAGRTGEAGLPPLRVTVNCSTCQLRHAGAVDELRQLLVETGTQACWLCVELKEGAFRSRDKNLLQALQQLRELGASILLDNFGAGPASLTALRTAPIDGVKIDRTLACVKPDPGSFGNDARGFARAVTQLVRSVGKTVLIEGIETEQQARDLQDLDLDYTQGYFFARPMDAEAATRFLSLTPRWRMSA